MITFFLGDAGLTLLENLAYAENYLEPCRKSSLRALVYGLVRLGEILTALAVTDYNVLNAAFLEH